MATGEWTEPDFKVIEKAYGWTVADDGEVWALIAGDQGYVPSGIKIPVEDLQIWAKYNYKKDDDG